MTYIAYENIVTNNYLCTMCSVYYEDIKHVLFECNVAREVWNNLGLLELTEEACMLDHSGSVYFTNS